MNKKTCGKCKYFEYLKSNDNFLFSGFCNKHNNDGYGYIESVHKFHVCEKFENKLIINNPAPKK